MRASTALLSFILAINIPVVHAQKWEAASIKRCNNEPGGEQGSAPLNDSPNRIRLSCYPVSMLIQDAYVMFAGGHWNGGHPGSVKIEQIPGWASSERYTVEAKAEGSPGQMMMLRPMLQSLLENRFAWWLTGLPRTLDAPVVNKTGLVGYFRFNFKPCQTLSAPPFTVTDPVMESARAALQDIGLKLTATKAPRRHLVVDHVEQPSVN